MSALDGLKNKNAKILQARALRLAVIQQQYDAGNLLLDEAREVLAGPLTPGDETTIVDDSGQLVIKPEDRAASQDEADHFDEPFGFDPDEDYSDDDAIEAGD